MRALEAGRAFIKFALQDRGLQKGLRKIERRLSSTGASLQRIGATGVAAAGAITAAVAPAVGIFAEFDDKMRVVRAVTGATAKEFAELTEEAKRLGATTSFSASQVADAMAELGRAGFRPRQILDSTESVLALSRATNTELPRAAEIGGAALRAFGLDASEMGRVADTLTATANGTAQGLEDLFEGLKPVAPIAAEAGESLEDTAAAIGILANNGIKGSLAGNALARAYKNLATEKTQEKLDAIGVAALDQADNLRPLIDIIGDVGKALENEGEAGRLAVFEQVFGRGQAAALKLAKAAGGEFQQLAEQIRNSAGQAVATAEQMDAGVGGSFRRFLSAAEGIAIALGDALAPSIAMVTERVVEIAGQVTGWIGNNQELVIQIAAAVGVVGALGAAILTVGTAFSVAAVAVSGLSTAVGFASSVMGTLATVLASPVAVIGILVTAVAALVDWFFFGGRGAQFLFDVVKSVFGSIASFVGRKIQEVLGYLGSFVSELLGLDEQAGKVEGLNNQLEKTAGLTKGLDGASLPAASSKQQAAAAQQAAELQAAAAAAAAQVSTAPTRAAAAAVAEGPLTERIAIATERAVKILDDIERSGATGGFRFA